MSKTKVENSLDFLTQPHYSIPARPDFLSDDFQLHLSEQSKRLYELGQPGQGYVGLVDLANGEIHLVPAFNANDGLQRKDKNGHPFDCSVESSASLGQLSGDLHLQAVSKLNLSREIEDPQEASEVEGKKFKKILGFGIWKEGAPVRFLPEMPSELGLVPKEYIFVKSNGTYQLTFIEFNREQRNIPLEKVPGLSEFLSSCSSNGLPPNEIDPQDRQHIEFLVKEYHDHSSSSEIEQSTANNIKFAKNRSTSQNATAIQHSPEYTTWFLGSCMGHSSHVNDLVRELPHAVFTKIMGTVTSELAIDSIDIFESAVIPDDMDSIRGHLRLEKDWETKKSAVLLEYGVYTNNDILIQKALDLGARLSRSVEALARFSIENHRTVDLMTKLIKLSATYAPDEISMIISELEWLKRNQPPFRSKEEHEHVKNQIDGAIEVLDKLSKINESAAKAIDAGKAKLALKLLSNGANPNYSKKGQSLFILAINKNLPELVDKMLDMQLTPKTLQNAIVYLSENIDKDPRYQKLLITILERSQQIRFIDPEKSKIEDVNLVAPTPRNAPETKQPEPGDVASSAKIRTILLTKQSFVSLTQALLNNGQVDFAIQLFHSVPKDMQEDFYNQPVNEASNITINAYFQDRIAAIELEKSRPVQFHFAPPFKPEYDSEKASYLSLMNETTEPTKKAKLQQFLQRVDTLETTDPSIIAEALYEHRQFVQNSRSRNHEGHYQDQLVTRLLGDPQKFLESGFAEASSLQKETFLLRNITNEDIVHQILSRDDFEPSVSCINRAIKIAEQNDLDDIAFELMEKRDNNSSSYAS